ncbi:MAG: M56 family metallopeptidase, partial [Bacteroidota bacterium]
MDKLVDALGWTILHSLWQAVLLAAVLWLASRAIQSARWRYRLAFGTLLTQLLVSIGTFGWLYEPRVAASSLPTDGPVYAVFVAAEGSGVGGWNPAAFLFWVVVFWGVGLVCGSLRLGLSFGRVRRMRRTVQASTPVAFRNRVESLAERIGYSGRLRIGVNPLLDGPALVGHLKPVLLFPLSVVNQLTPDEAEAVILHELAHLQRKDHWWNLLQCLIEVIFYYHPVIWWIGARIREEREHCCDDLVLQFGPGRLAYAKVLLYFEENRTTPATAVALTNTPNGLLGRVQRFLHQQNIPYQMKSRLFLLPLLTLIALVTTAAYHPASTIVEPEMTAVPSLPLAPISAPDFGSGTLNPLPLKPTLPAIAIVQPDTLPQGRHQVKSYRNGKSTEFIVEDGAIQELKIDGETIPPAEYDEHEAMVERMLGGGDADLRLYRFPGDRERFFNFDAEGERWEEFGERMGEMGERLGESFEQMFQFDGDGNGIFRFHSDGEDGTFLFDMDSLIGTFPEGFRSFQVLPDGRVEGIRRNEDGDVEYQLRDLLREKERSLQEEERELREMETMIERLERKKAEKERALEKRRQEEGEDRVRELRGKAQNRGSGLEENQALLRAQQLERLAELERNQAKRQAELRENQAELRRQNEERIAKLRHDNEERLAQLRAKERESRGVDYEVVIEQ